MRETQIINIIIQMAGIVSDAPLRQCNTLLYTSGWWQFRFLKKFYRSFGTKLPLAEFRASVLHFSTHILTNAPTLSLLPSTLDTVLLMHFQTFQGTYLFHVLIKRNHFYRIVPNTIHGNEESAFCGAIMGIIERALITLRTIDAIGPR